MAAEFPNSPKPYNLRYELLFLEYDYTKRDNYTNQKVKLLNKALAVDSLDQETYIIFPKPITRTLFTLLKKNTQCLKLWKTPQINLRNQHLTTQLTVH